MKSKKIIIITIMLIICSIFICKDVQAVKMNMDIDKQEIKPGDEIKISIKTSELDNGELVNVLQGKLEYNQKDWELVNNSNVTAKNNWSVIFNDEPNESYGEFILINFEGTNNETEVFEITLKAKDKLINTKSNIKLVNLCTTDGTEVINLEDVNQTVKIEGRLPILVIVVLVVAIIAVLILITIKIKNKNKMKQENVEK